MHVHGWPLAAYSARNVCSNVSLDLSRDGLRGRDRAKRPHLQVPDLTQTHTELPTGVPVVSKLRDPGRDKVRDVAALTPQTKKILYDPVQGHDDASAGILHDAFDEDAFHRKPVG